MDGNYRIQRSGPRTFLLTINWLTASSVHTYSEHCLELSRFAGQIKKWCYDNGITCVIRPRSRTKSIARKSAYTISVRKDADVLAFMLKWC